MAMGQKPAPPVNIPLPTKIGSKMGGEFTYPKMGSQNGFDPQTNETLDGVGWQVEGLLDFCDLAAANNLEGLEADGQITRKALQLVNCQFKSCVFIMYDIIRI